MMFLSFVAHVRHDFDNAATSLSDEVNPIINSFVADVNDTLTVIRLYLLVLQSNIYEK